MEVKTVRLVNEQPRGLFTQHTGRLIVEDDDMDSDTVAESESLHQNTGNSLTMKPIFDTSQKLIVGQSDEIYGVTPINWEDSEWKH